MWSLMQEYEIIFYLQVCILMWHPPIALLGGFVPAWAFLHMLWEKSTALLKHILLVLAQEDFQQSSLT